MQWELPFFIFSMTTITAGCLVPLRWLPPLPNDKFLHFIAFGGLTLIASRLTQNIEQLLACSIGIFFIGLAIEGLQNYVPGRKFCWRDLAANTMGIVVAGLLSHFTIGP